MSAWIIFHDDVIKWKYFPRYWPFVRAQRPVTRSFDVFFDLRLNKRLSKQSWSWWFETLSRPLWRHRNVYVRMNYVTPGKISPLHLLCTFWMNIFFGVIIRWKKWKNKFRNKIISSSIFQENNVLGWQIHLNYSFRDNYNSYTLLQSGLLLPTNIGDISIMKMNKVHELGYSLSPYEL